jgi:hypothetical protein
MDRFDTTASIAPDKVNPRISAHRIAQNIPKDSCRASRISLPIEPMSTETMAAPQNTPGGYDSSPPTDPRATLRRTWAGPC